MTQIMERTNELLFQMILYISVIWILSNCQQLYESECNSQHDSFYRVCKVNALETTIQRSEKQNKELLLRLSDREQKNLKSIAAYRDILKLYGSQIVPNDTSIAEICLQHTELVIGSSTDCHRYYNCSEQSSFVHKKWPTPYLHECVYPFMFSEETLKCENYSEVFCGKRFEATWECRYFFHQYESPISILPCQDRFPKCEGYEDGLWSTFERRIGPSWYKICKNNRTISIGQCPFDEVLNTQTFIVNGTCDVLQVVIKNSTTV